MKLVHKNIKAIQSKNGENGTVYWKKINIEIHVNWMQQEFVYIG